MHLLTKTTLYYITVSLFVFFFGGIGIYQMIKSLEEENVVQGLHDQMHRFKHDINLIKAPLHTTTIISGGLIEIKHVHNVNLEQMIYSDTLIYDFISKRLAPFKKLTFYFEKDELVYRTIIYKSMTESNYLIERVALIITIIVVVFLAAVFFLYRYFLGKIWAEFFETLNKIKDFDLQSPENISFPKSMIIEFNQLNQVLEKMMGRINSDFVGLKEFSGNLTHEIQTPLAVIKSKTGLLIQDENATEKQMMLAGEINRETLRISKLIKALGLFAKLDNHQYTEREKVDLQALIDSKIELFEDFIDAKELEINIEYAEKYNLHMHAELADILFTNLLKNAVRHNIANGNINIVVKSNSIYFENSGEELSFDPQILFNRFIKASKDSASLGIGLSLVKKICDYYNFEISYQQKNAIHKIQIYFD